MPSVLTGANLANRDLVYLGVSGDGDSASIGSASSRIAMRRGVNMTYIVENNGVYGLTKGQFSATADKGSKSKRGVREHRRADRPGRDGAAARRHLRRAQLLGRQGQQLVPLIKARSCTRARLHRRDQPLRRLQQPRRLDQELRLRARAQRGGEPARRHHRRAEITADYAPGPPPGRDASNCGASTATAPRSPAWTSSWTGPPASRRRSRAAFRTRARVRRG
jgi:hypothetical protein